MCLSRLSQPILLSTWTKPSNILTTGVCCFVVFLLLLLLLLLLLSSSSSSSSSSYICVYVCAYVRMDVCMCVCMSRCMTISMYCLYVWVDYTYIDVNVLNPLWPHKFSFKPLLGLEPMAPIYPQLPARHRDIPICM